GRRASSRTGSAAAARRWALPWPGPARQTRSPSVLISGWSPTRARNYEISVTAAAICAAARRWRTLLCRRAQQSRRWRLRGPTGSAAVSAMSRVATVSLSRGRMGKVSMPKTEWLFYAFLSAFFAALTTILAKLGVQGVSSNVATAIRTVVILFLAWGWIFATGEVNQVSAIPQKTLIFLLLSGVATGLS